MKQSRRTFIKTSLIAGSGLALMDLPTLAGQLRPDKDAEVLKGFIVSDAHFGWESNKQPKSEKQVRAMQNIISRFPDLDLFFDTGDAHHNDHHSNKDPYQARKDWIDIIQGGCGQVPFYYVIGNHEIRSNEDNDPEMRCNIMGSTPCRPYYSFDVMGIHFISIPELIRAIHITEEEWEWLELDLAINRDKTIIMLSHNNILGTTWGDTPGYRGIMESDRMKRIFKQHPNIISWMHGHNHNFQIVNQNNMLFVSNGRIGGFDPSRGKYGLGGIYFEISADGLVVRGYSGEQGKFLDEYDSNLSQEIKTQTSFDPKQAFGYSYGIGGAANKRRIPAYHHHTGENARAELFLTGCDNGVINDDHKMTKYVERPAYHGLDKILLAARVNHGNNNWEYLDPGIRLKANSDWWTTVTMPSDHYNRYTYYRCPLGAQYKVSIDMDVKSPAGQKLWLRLHVHDIEGRKLRIVQSAPFDLGPGRQTRSCDLKIPEAEELESVYHEVENIYKDLQSDKLVQVFIEASFTSMESDVDVFALKMEQDPTDGQTLNPGVIVDGQKYQVSGVLRRGEIKRIPIGKMTSSRSVNEVVAGGNKRLTYIVRRTNLTWQVRNATVSYRDDHLEINELRNRMSDKEEIILVPMHRYDAPYLHRIRKAERIKYYPYNSSSHALNIEIGKVNGTARVDILSMKKPANIRGVDGWTYKGNVISLKRKRSGKIHVQF